MTFFRCLNAAQHPPWMLTCGNPAERLCLLLSVHPENKILKERKQYIKKKIKLRKSTKEKIPDKVNLFSFRSMI